MKYNLKRYIDKAVRREVRRHLDEDEVKAKAAVLEQKSQGITSKLKAFAAKHPNVATLLRIWLKISTVCHGIAVGVLVSMTAAKTGLKLCGDASKEIAAMQDSLPSSLSMLLSAAIHTFVGYFKWMIAKDLQPE